MTGFLGLFRFRNIASIGWRGCHVLAGLAVAVWPIAAPAQSFMNEATQRAVNTARMRAEAINGGLSSYRPAACMYVSSGNPCLVEKNEKGYLFRFLGGVPGWQQLGIAATVETVIQIAHDGRTVLEVVYNGPPRSPS